MRKWKEKMVRVWRRKIEVKIMQGRKRCGGGKERVWKAEEEGRLEGHEKDKKFYVGKCSGS